MTPAPIPSYVTHKRLQLHWFYALRAAAVALGLGLGACEALFGTPEDLRSGELAPSHDDDARVDAARADADAGASEHCEALPGSATLDFTEGEQGAALAVGPEGQAATTPTLTPASCTCDRAHPPTSLGLFLRCFETDLHAWGIQLSVEGNDVVTKTGQHYARQPFESEFASSVYLEVKDIERAEIILRAYDRQLQPVLLHDKALRQAMQWWILRYYRFFAPGRGTVDDFIIDYPNQLSLYENLAPFNRGGWYYPQFRAFIEQISHEYADLAPAPVHAAGARPVVRIVTGPYGGGHVSVASSLSTALSRDYDVATIDECRAYAGALDTLTDNAYRGCLLYNDIEVAQADPEKAALLAHLNWLLSFYLLPDQRGGLRRTLRADQTDLVISTVHHLPEVTSAATALGRPTLIAVTDFSFPAGQYFDLNHVSPRLVQYLVPTIQRDFFRPLMLEYYAKSWEARVASARTRYIHDQLFATPGAPALTPEMLAKLEVFNLLGFPVDASMHPPADAAEVMKARTTLGLGTYPKRKIIAVSFGSTVQPTRTLQLLEIALRHADQVLDPFEIALVSGGSTAVIDGATQLFQAHGVRSDGAAESADKPFSDHVTAKVFPRLTQQEIAELYRATDAYVSKAGGATTAELIASSTQFVRGFGLWPWEYENALWLGRLGLSRENPAEPADPLQLDRSFLGVEPKVDQIASAVNDTLALPRLYGLVPGALSFDAGTLESIVNRTLAQ